MVKIVAIIRARMGSTRLPGKVMADLRGKPALEHVLERVRRSKHIQEIWLVTTINKKDDILESWAEKNSVLCYRGSDFDVLDSYYQAARLAKAEAIVRITGDCPLIDYKIIDQVVGAYLAGNFDYIANTQPSTFPDGFDVEIFSFSALEKTWQEAKLGSEREHVTPYIWKNPKLFKIKNITHHEDLSKYRLTLDTPEDLKLLRLIFQECNKIQGYCDLESVLEIVKRHPDWSKLNICHKRNEGYFKSLKEDAG